MNRSGLPSGRVAVGHPIDVASGDFFADDIDFELTGVAQLTFGRTYNTRFLRSGELSQLGSAPNAYLPYGHGWRPSWLHQLRTTLTGFVYTKADGTELVLDDSLEMFDKYGRVLSPVHSLELTKLDNGNVRLVGFGRDRETQSLVFEPHNAGSFRLSAIERTKEARIDIVYDTTADLPTSLVQRRERRALILEHSDKLGRLSTVHLRLADGSIRQVLGFGYDAHGRLSEVADERGLSARYTYDDAGRMTNDEKRGGALYTIRYDRRGRCTYAAGSGRYEERTLRFDESARTTLVRDSHGGVTTYEWNEAGQVVKTTTPEGEITRSNFDELGRLTSQTDANGVCSEVTYDELGHVLEDRILGGSTLRYEYDANHNLLNTYELDGNSGELLFRTQFSYDGDHNLVRAQENDDPPWQYVYSRWGELLSTQAPSGATSHHAYNDIGGLERATDFDGHEWTWTRDLFGRVLSEIDPLGHTWKVDYLDAEGRSTRLTEPDGRVYIHLISDDDRIIRQLLPGGRVRHAELSFCGLLTSVTDEEGAVTRLAWGTEPGELTSIVNANGHEYRFGYDADMRLVSRRTFDGRVLRTKWEGERKAITWDAANRPTQYSYDGVGRLQCQRNADGETNFSYDRRGFVTRLASPSSTLELQRDRNGRVVAETRDGIRVTRQLDIMGLPTSQTSSRGYHAHFAWSQTGLLRSVQYKDTAITFERDAVGREVRRHLGEAGTLDSHHDPVGRIISQAFRPRAPRAGDGGSLLSFSRRYGFDARGFIATIEDSLRGSAGILHNDRGDLTGAIRAEGESDFYVFDPNRNRAYATATTDGAALGAALEGARISGRRIGASELEELASSLRHLSRTFVHGLGDRLQVLEEPGRRVELTYDANGQVIEKAVLSAGTRTTWKYDWSASGELVGLTTPNGARWSYRYDPAGRRVEKRGPTPSTPSIDCWNTAGSVEPVPQYTTWSYVWLGEELLETLKDDVLVETYVSEPDGSGSLLRDDGRIHFIVGDQLDSASEEVDSCGRLEWAMRKGIWGENSKPRGVTGGQPFVGQWLDAESGLHYNRFRYYDPDTGRYLSPDPIDILGGPNAYSSITDPLSDVDPDGLVSPYAPNYGVYHIVDTAQNDKVVYVGITHVGPNNDSTRREGQHQRSGRLDPGQRYQLVPVAQGISYAAARGYEQADIAHYKTLRTRRQGKPIRAGDANRARSYNPLRKVGKWRLRLFKKFEKERKKFHAEGCGG